MQITYMNLFFEVANGVFISIREKVENFMLYVVFFKMVHQMGSVSLKEYLSIGRFKRWNDYSIIKAWHSYFDLFI